MKMSKDTPYGLALLLSGAVLIIFAAAVFLGLSGMCRGQLIMPIVAVMAGVLVVFYSLIRICRSKLSKSRRNGLMGELLGAALMLVIMMSGASPVSNVISVLEDKENLQSSVDSIVDEVADIPKEYKIYVDERIQSYKTHLLSLTPGTEDYERQLSRAAGESRQEKAKFIARSLQRRLYNPNMEAVEAERTAWLLTLNNVDAFSQRTVSMVAAAALEWIDEYREISTIEYLGEDTEPFEMPELEEKLSAYELNRSDFLHPTVFGGGIALVCYILVLIPYLLIRRSGKEKSGTHE